MWVWAILIRVMGMRSMRPFISTLGSRPYLKPISIVMGMSKASHFHYRHHHQNHLCHWAHCQLHRRLHQSPPSHHPPSRSAAHAHSHVPALAAEATGWTGLGQLRWHRCVAIDSVPRLGEGDEPSDWDWREEGEGDLARWHGTASWYDGGLAPGVEHCCLQWYAWWPLRSVERLLSVSEASNKGRSGMMTGSSEIRHKIPILID